MRGWMGHQLIMGACAVEVFMRGWMGHRLIMGHMHGGIYAWVDGSSVIMGTYAVDQHHTGLKQVDS